MTVPHNNGAVKTAPYEKMQSEISKMRRGITRQRFLLQSKKTLRGDKNILDF